jgi:diguanylate cyclase (GGDEF)-like protein
MNYNIFNNLLESIVVVDSAYNVIYANEAFSVLINFPLKRILKNKKIFEVMNTNEPLLNNLQLLQATEEPTPYKEITFTTPQDQKGTIQYSLQKLTEAINSRWLIFFRDVTLEQQLQKKYKRELSEKETLIDKLRSSLLETEFRYKINEITCSCFDVNEVINSLTSLFKDLFICENSASIIFDTQSITLYLANGDKKILKQDDYHFFETYDFTNYKTTPELTTKLQRWLPWQDLDQLGYYVPLKSQKNNLGLLFFYHPQIAHFNEAKLYEMLKSIQGHISLVLDNFLLYEKSVRDGLTNLYNVRYFKSSLLKELKRTRRHEHSCSLIMIDLDFFKKINDNYGHPTGDNVLKKISDIFMDCTRETDIVARCGGEEFAIILPETPGEGAMIVAEKIRKTTEETKFYSTASIQISVTVSLGVATFPEDAEVTETLIDKADQALYAAKHGGRNRIQKYFEKMDKDLT